MKKLFVLLTIMIYQPAISGEYLGNLSNNPTLQKSNKINKYNAYGSEYSNRSTTNPYATKAPKLYDSEGNYRGRLSSNPYDPDSVSNPYGKYGSKYSPDSINNPYGAGSKYQKDSPFNEYGTGLIVIGEE